MNTHSLLVPSGCRKQEKEEVRRRGWAMRGRATWTGCGQVMEAWENQQDVHFMKRYPKGQAELQKPFKYTTVTKRSRRIRPTHPG